VLLILCVNKTGSQTDNILLFMITGFFLAITFGLFVVSFILFRKTDRLPRRTNLAWLLYILLYLLQWLFLLTIKFTFRNIRKGQSDNELALCIQIVLVRYITLQKTFTKSTLISSLFFWDQKGAYSSLLTYDEINHWIALKSGWTCHHSPCFIMGNCNAHFN
jgi:cbb3-type cytochrome oxidase subunit 3